MMRNNEKVDSIETERRCVLGKAVELAGPHFDFVVIVHNVVIGFKATVVEILVLIDARIIVIGKVWHFVQKGKKRSAEQMSRTASCDASPGILCCHVVPYSVWTQCQRTSYGGSSAKPFPVGLTCDDLDSCCVA
jgi:hypothetical protein